MILIYVNCKLFSFISIILDDFYQNDQPQFTETTTEEVDPVTGSK